MKRMLLTLSMATAIFALLVTNALAFHDEGVARCAGCHTMHNSENGQLIDAAHPNGNGYLLRKATASDMCLSCHASGHGSVWGSDPLHPPAEKGGGNFVYEQAANLNDGRNGHSSPIVGSYGVHNINAPSMNSVADPALTSAPGGTYPASALSCTSCHNPHGNTNFRLLYGAGHVEAGNWTFSNAAPSAVGINIEDASAESPTNHTAYNGGMSAWCANCHGDYHNNSAKMIHPSGVALGGGIAQIYGLYRGTGQASGDPSTSYIPQVPFEDGSMTTTSTAGPTGTSQVSCISCHRAHGTSAPNIGRWDFNITTWANEGVESSSYAIPNPYAATSGNTQRSLCNKCHAKDQG
jgi:hypothetical protein